MSSNKQKNRENNQRTVSQKKVVPVAGESRQTRAPGAGPGKREASSGNLQSGFGGSEEGERGGPGTQQAGWSSRQQAERIEARGEESRLGLPQQSGYGGLQQDQHAGSQESSIGPPGSLQSTNRGPRQRQAGASGSSPGSPGTKSKRGASK